MGDGDGPVTPSPDHVGAAIRRWPGRFERHAVARAMPVSYPQSVGANVLFDDGGSPYGRIAARFVYAIGRR
jgi:hypothetical protein